MTVNAVEFKHSQLFAGKVHDITRVKVAAGTYKKGDILENVVTGENKDTLSATWAKAKTDAVLANYYVVCADDVEAEANDEVVAYPNGTFNAEVVKINDKKVSAKSVEILKTKNIFIEEVIKA